MVWQSTEPIREEVLQQCPPGGYPSVAEIWISYPELEYVRGLYVVEVGYQRKGMSMDFYEQFTDSFYVRRADVERAATLLDLEGTHEETRAKQDYFFAQFLAQFEEGVSVFHVSF